MDTLDSRHTVQKGQLLIDDWQLFGGYRYHACFLIVTFYLIKIMINLIL
jgi:hypothetical protein